MELNKYRITIRTTATLVYYLSEYDMDKAIDMALEAPYREWEVSEFDEVWREDVIAEETRL
jgi:hypothetical protein